METLNKLSKSTTKQQKRVGRGYGSGVGGHTTGRGAKGDKIRGKTKITFDGSKIKKGWIKRLPFLRGKHRVLSKRDLFVFNFIDLERMFKADDMVDAVTLAKKTGISEKILIGRTKILAKGKLTKVLNFKGVLFSDKAKSLIISTGGKID
jgi:large subunit ribosomal protein L15